MAEWTKQYPVNFTPSGDTTSQALEKHINELARIYELLNRVRKFDAGTIAPTDPIEGHFWLDTSNSPWRLKVYNGTDWVDILVGNADTVDGKHASSFVPVDSDSDISISISGIQVLNISSAGILTLPKQSACVVYLSTDQNIPAGSTTKIALDAVISDIQNEFDSTNNRITVTEDGVYVVIGNVEFVVAAAGDVLRVYICVNGGTKAVVGLTTNDTNYHILPISKVFQLSAGDYIELYARNMTSNDTIKAGLGITYLCVAKVA